MLVNVVCIVRVLVELQVEQFEVNEVRAEIVNHFYFVLYLLETRHEVYVFLQRQVHVVQYVDRVDMQQVNLTLLAADQVFQLHVHQVYVFVLLVQLVAQVVDGVNRHLDAVVEPFLEHLQHCLLALELVRQVDDRHVDDLQNHRVLPVHVLLI